MFRNSFLFFLVLLFGTLVYAENADSTTVQEKYLHISTNPSHADVYINTAKPSHASSPDYTLPGFIPVPAGESSILVSIFRPEYADTAIQVTLSQKDTSFLIVALRPNLDESVTEKQYGELAHRSRRKVGHRLLIASIVPFVASGIAAAVSYYNIERANSKKDDIDDALFYDGNAYKQSFDDFKNYRDNARKAKNVMNFGLILGGIVFTTGVILSF